MAGFPEKMENLDVCLSVPFPSMLLINKRLCDEDPETKAAETLRMKRRSEGILDRVKMFVPHMEKSEKELSERLKLLANPAEADIENLTDGEPAVELNLALFEYASSKESSDDDTDTDSTDAEDTPTETKSSERLKRDPSPLLTDLRSTRMRNNEDPLT